MPPVMPYMPQPGKPIPGGPGGQAGQDFFPTFKTPWGTSDYSSTGMPGGGRGNPLDPNKGGLSMYDILTQSFLPFLNQQIGTQGPIGQAFFDATLRPGANFGQAETAAQGYGANLFRVGGPLQKNILGAVGGMAGKGFQPSGAEGEVNAITRGGVNDISNFFASQAGTLEQERLRNLASAFGGANQNIMDMIQSLFSGQGSIAQLGLAAKSAPKGGLLGLGFGPL